MKNINEVAETVANNIINFFSVKDDAEQGEAPFTAENARDMIARAGAKNCPENPALFSHAIKKTLRRVDESGEVYRWAFPSDEFGV